MKKIIFGLIFGLSLLWGRTLIVDKNYSNGGVNCLGEYNNTYTTIQSAIDHAYDGDVIKICPGIYDESINLNKSISFIGTSGNRDDVLITQQNARAISISGWPQNITIKDITIESQGSDAIYFNNQSPFLVHFENVYIKAKKKGIYFKGNIDGVFKIKDVLIDSKEECIEIDGDVNNGLNFVNLILKGSKGIYLKNNLHHQNLFENISIESSEESIKINGFVAETLNLKKINVISTNKKGLLVKGYIYNGIFISDSNISGKNGAIWFKKDISGDILIQNSTFNSENEKGIVFESTINNRFTISQSSISSKDDSLNISGNVNGGLFIENTNITSNLEDGVDMKGHIYSSNGDDAFLVKNSNIKANKRALNLDYGKQLNIKLENSYFESKSDDTVKLKLADWVSVIATGNCFKTLGNGNYAFYLDINYFNNIQINNNCFYATSTDKLAMFKSSWNYNYDWNGNYWDGFIGNSYNYNNVVDNNPLSKCNNNCGDNNIPNCNFKNGIRLSTYDIT